MKKLRLEVEKVRGNCTRGYKPGDRWTLHGYSTPDAFCGSSYTMLFPVITALLSGGRFDYEDDPFNKTNMGCPDGGTVVFRITLEE